MRHLFPLATLLLGTACATAGSTADGRPEPLAPPETIRHEVKDAYYSVEVVDPYRWLEPGDDGEVKKWIDAQNAYAQASLARLPERDAIAADVRAVLAAEIVSHYDPIEAGGSLFMMRRQPPKQQPFLVVMASADRPDEARVLLDPAVIDPAGGTAIDWYRPSADGKLLAVSLSKGGSESGDLHLFDVATGKELGDAIQRVHGGTAGGDLAWLPDGSGFFYTRYPREGERPAEDLGFYQQLWFHSLAPGSQDRYEIGKDFPKIAEIQVEVDRSGLVLVGMQKGDGGEFAHFLRDKSGQWKQLTKLEDQVVQLNFGSKQDLYLVSHQNAPKGKLLRMPLSAPDLAKAETVIKEGEATIYTDFLGPATVVATDRALYVVYQNGGPSEIRAFDLSGKPSAAPPQLPVSTVGAPMRLADGSLLFFNASFVEPTGWYRYDPASGKSTKLAISSKAPVDLSGLEVVREMATSKDGTQVPVNIIKPKGIVLDGSNPCVVTGYGGYGVSITPRHQGAAYAFLKRGVIVAIANLRGGGEFGEDWHHQGNLTRKQNVFDDFAAVLQHLIEKKYTRSDRLGIFGGSNGGLLMGATITQHPELAKAAVSTVGIYDMLRVELSPNGAFNVPEFGSVKDPEQFKALHAYSPYHHVADGARYPALLMMTGANDPRVDPMHSRKFAARLQAATKGTTPILLRTDFDAGHGIGSKLETQISQLTDAQAFLLAQIGVTH